MKLKPSKSQLEFFDWKFGIFFHFGIRSFYPGHKDWDGVSMPATAFNPEKLDCESWIKTAKEAGATYTILTTKHHDGFCLWPSKYTEYCVKNSPWKDGCGDVVAEYIAASRKYGMKVGLYYSPAQWGEGAVPFSNAKEYDDYFINQLGELLTNYGKIDYLWFDGCGSEGHEYDKKRIAAEILRMQPDILTFCDPEWYPSVRWVGNEDGFASLNNPLVVDGAEFSEKLPEAQKLSGEFFLPSECDCKMRKTWFFDYNEDTIKSLDELFGMYEGSVGHGSNFLLNISPDSRGLLPDADTARLLELGEKIKKAYGNPIPGFAPIEKEEGEGYVFSRTHEDIPLGWDKSHVSSAKLVNRIEIKEDLTNGQAIKAFEVYVNLPNYNWVTHLAYCGKTVGGHVICPIPAMKVKKITVKVTDFEGEVKIKEINAYYVE